MYTGDDFIRFREILLTLPLYFGTLAAHIAWEAFLLFQNAHIVVGATTAAAGTKGMFVPETYKIHVHYTLKRDIMYSTTTTGML